MRRARGSEANELREPEQNRSISLVGVRSFAISPRRASFGVVPFVGSRSRDHSLLAARSIRLAAHTHAPRRSPTRSHECRVPTTTTTSTATRYDCSRIGRIWQSSNMATEGACV